MPTATLHKVSQAHAQARQDIQAKAETIGALYKKLQARLQAILDNPRSKAGDALVAKRLLAEAKQLIGSTQDKAKRWIEENLTGAAKMGVDVADKTATAQDVEPVDNLTLINEKAVKRAIRDTFSDLAGQTEQITERMTTAIRDRAAQAIRQAVARGASPSTTSRELLDALVSEGFTPQAVFDKLAKSMKDLSPKSKSEALRKLVDTGQLTAFVDRGGRVWEPADYVRMVAQTKQAILFNAANTSRLKQNGVTLAQITKTNAHVDPLCGPFQGLIVALTKEAAERLGLTTLDQCLGGGPPFHPNCRHAVIGRVEALVSDAEIDRARQQTKRIDSLLGIDDPREFRLRAIDLDF